MYQDESNIFRKLFLLKLPFCDCKC